MSSLNPIEAMQSYLESFNKLQAEKEKLEAECKTLKEQLEKTQEEFALYQEHTNDMDKQIAYILKMENRAEAVPKFLLNNLRYMAPMHLKMIIDRLGFDFLTIEITRAICALDQKEMIRMIVKHIYGTILMKDELERKIQSGLTVDEKIKFILEMFVSERDTMCYIFDPTWKGAFALLEAHQEEEGSKLVPSTNKQKLFDTLIDHCANVVLARSSETECLIYNLVVTAKKHNLQFDMENLVKRIGCECPCLCTLMEGDILEYLKEAHVEKSKMKWSGEAFDKLNEKEKVYYISRAQMECIDVDFITSPNLAVIYFSRKLQQDRNGVRRFVDLTTLEMRLLSKYYKYLFRVLDSFDYKDSYEEDFPKLKELIQEASIEMKVKQIVPAQQSLELEHYRNQEQRIKNFIESRIEKINNGDGSYYNFSSIIRTHSKTGKVTYFMVIETDSNLSFKTFYIPVSEQVAFGTKREIQKINASIDVETQIKLCHIDDRYIVCTSFSTRVTSLAKKDIDSETLMMWYDLHMKTKLLKKN